MKLKNLIAAGLVGVCTALPATLLNAKVSEQEAQKLKKELTPMGAERAGNADGSIPAWTGSMRGLPEGLEYSGSGDVYPDPYGDDKLLFTITAANMDKYADKLSEGQKALLKKYPDTFKIPVYPTHRDGRFSQIVEDRTWFNALNTELVNGVDGLHNFTGGAPFPIPKQGAEVIMNGRVIHPHPAQDALLDDMAVYQNNSRSSRRQLILADYPYANPDNEVGKVDEDISVNAGLVFITVEGPPREKGKLTIVQEPLDAITYKRNAWIYLPGSRRVRRAPTVGYDTPDGPGGLVTIDDTLGFNGALDRFEWKLLGKQEIYVPFHNYKFDDPNVKYDELLPVSHANPDYMRYELRRVWVVEAELKPGARHVYGKRRFYVEEDSWQFVLTENYDGRGDLWRVGILNTLYDYYVKGYINRAEVFHDLQSAAYVAIRLVNETRPTRYDVEPLGADFYTPQNLRKLGRR
jgi:hypothetical protein